MVAGMSDKPKRYCVQSVAYTWADSPAEAKRTAAQAAEADAEGRKFSGVELRVEVMETPRRGSWFRRSDA
jgi:hypothetical protein